MLRPEARPTTRRALLAAAVAAVGVAGAMVLARRPRPAPAATFRLIDGRALRLADLLGRPVAVSFWATTCRTCVAETPGFSRLYTDLAPDGFELIAVAMPYDPPYLVVDFARDRALPYPVALDVDGVVTRAFGDIRYTPTVLLIDPEGRVAERYEGAGIPDALRSGVAPWLGPAATRT